MYRDAECRDGEGECGEDIPSPIRLGGLGERRSSPGGVRGRAPVKNRNNFGAFCNRKLPMMNGILLIVAKCCVTGLYLSHVKMNTR